MIPTVPGLSGEHAREWRLFARWCAAADLAALPAGAPVVVEYLEDNPGTSAMQRGRVTAINDAHRRMRLPIPGEAEVVRQVLNPGRRERMAGYRARVDELLPCLSIEGWPAGVFGRRDAVILLLAASGLSWRQIAELRQRDVHIGDEEVAVGPQPLATLAATETVCPVAVFQRWAQLLAVAPPATGHVHLERTLTEGAEQDTALRREFGALPLVAGFDARGWPLGLPGELEPLTAGTIAAITATHLTTPAPVPSVEDLDPDSYERGIAARHRAKRIGEDLDELFQRIDELADSVLEVSRNPLRTTGYGFS